MAGDGVDAFLMRLFERALGNTPRQFRVLLQYELKTILQFDAGFWATGDLYRGMLTLTEWQWNGIPDFDAATRTPQFLEMLHQRHSVRVDSIITNPTFATVPFYQSDLGPRGIHHVMALSEIDRRGQLRNMIMLARRDKEKPFTDDQIALANRLAPLLFHSVEHNLRATVLHHTRRAPRPAVGVCDLQGNIFTASEPFEDALEERYGTVPTRLPVPIDGKTRTQTLKDLIVTVEPLEYSQAPTDAFFAVTLHPSNGLERLSPREMQLATAVCQAQTYKHIAHSLQISPSTVGNVMSRVYKKLGIQGRSNLMELMGYHEPREETEQESLA